MDRVIIKEIEIKALNSRGRKVRIILPKDYHETEKNYPVIYMMDGQNLIDISVFSGYSWDVINTMDDLHDLTNGFIVVGIDAAPRKRILEYSPYLPKGVKEYINKSVEVPLDEIKPEADPFGEFLVHQLKPMIDKGFRTKKQKEFTYIAGSSCGGVISIYLGLKYQDVFSIIGAFSPAYRFLAPNITKYVDNIIIKDHMKIYHDMGKKENGILSFLYIKTQNRFHNAILKQMNENRILKIAEKKALHNEYYWALRFKEFLYFCFSKNSA